MDVKLWFVDEQMANATSFGDLLSIIDQFPVLRERMLDLSLLEQGEGGDQG